MKILITGSSGAIGSSLAKFLAGKGFKITALSRNPKQKPYWDIEKDLIELNNQQFDIIINLAGENIANKYWSKKQKQKILDSRIKSTKLIFKYFSSLETKPNLIINASAIGFYGDRADTKLTEQATVGTGFLALVCQQWEQATKIDNNIRVINTRFAAVLDKNSGMLAKILPIFKLKIGGVLGSGKQFTSWISLNDLNRSILHIINNQIKGAVNICSPNPVTNYEFTKILGKILKAPTIFKTPAFILKLIYGEKAKELILPSTRAIPEKLINNGFEFEDSDLEIFLNKIIK